MISTLDVLPAPQVLDLGTERFRADVLRGLRGRHKELPCKYFYDEAGSALFEQITTLEEYYLTRTERAIMLQHAPEMGRLLGPRCLLVEYGSGSSSKTRLLLEHMQEPSAYVPVDVSEEFLYSSAGALALDFPELEVIPLGADFTRPFHLPTPVMPVQRRVVYFPGSTIGNFEPDESLALLRQTAALCGRDGGLLLGADLRKDPRIIEAAYNDVQGVTAAFNRNILVRINRELGADFAVEQFAHRAFYNSAAGRIEMHLVSQREQGVHLGDEEFHLAEGESIRTEYSHKYGFGDLIHLATRSGFEVQRLWTDEKKYFSVLYLTVQEARNRIAPAMASLSLPVGL